MEERSLYMKTSAFYRINSNLKSEIFAVTGFLNPFFLAFFRTASKVEPLQITLSSSVKATFILIFLK